MLSKRYYRGATSGEKVVKEWKLKERKIFQEQWSNQSGKCLGSWLRWRLKAIGLRSLVTLKRVILLSSGYRRPVGIGSTEKLCEKVGTVNAESVGHLVKKAYYKRSYECIVVEAL